MSVSQNLFGVGMPDVSWTVRLGGMGAKQVVLYKHLLISYIIIHSKYPPVLYLCFFLRCFLWLLIFDIYNYFLIYIYESEYGVYRERDAMNDRYDIIRIPSSSPLAI